VAENFPPATDESFIDSVEQSIALQLAVDREKVRVTQFEQERVRRLQETNVSRTRITIGFEVLPSDGAKVQGVVASLNEPSFSKSFTDKVVVVESSKGRIVDIKEVKVGAAEIELVSLSSTTKDFSWTLALATQIVENANQRFITTTMSENVNSEVLDAEALKTSIVTTTLPVKSTSLRENATVVGEGVAVTDPTDTGIVMTVWIVVITCTASSILAVMAAGLRTCTQKRRQSSVPQESSVSSTATEVQAPDEEVPTLLRSISHKFVKNAASLVPHPMASAASLADIESADGCKEFGEDGAPDTVLVIDDLNKWIASSDVSFGMPKGLGSETEFAV